MAGPQDVVIKANRACFLVKAAPGNWLTRIPYFGPLFTYDLGKSPKWRLTVTYLGIEHKPGQYNPKMKQAFEADTWVVDIVLAIGGEYHGSGDDLRIDIPTTVVESKAQKSSTKLFLERSGDAQLQVHHQTVYSFDVNDKSGTVVNWVIGFVAALILLVVGFVLGKN